MNSVIVALVLSAAAIRLEPATLTFGPDEAPIEFVAPGATSARVWCGTCTNRAGAVSSVEPVGPGRFRARFTFPKERFPRVVLLALETRSARGERSLNWVMLPLLANATLKLETKPRASVTVSIGTGKFGPAPADAKGKLTLQVIVPPGFRSATVVAGDRAGNVTTSAVDLAAQPFARAAAVLPDGEASADQRVSVEVFAVEAEGAPLVDASRVRVSAKLGEVEPPVPRSGGGFTVSYRAPKSIAGGPEVLTVAVEGSPASQLEIPLRPAAPALINLTLSRQTFTAGSGERVTVVAAVADAHGNPVEGIKPTVTSEFGAVEATPFGAELTVPDAFGGRREVRIRAAAPGLSGGVALALHAGPPVTAELALVGRVAAGNPVTGTLSVSDAWGNPAEATAVSVVGLGGREARVSATEGQGWEVGYQTAKDDSVGSFDLEVRAGERTLARSAVTLLPYQRAWAVGVGALVAGSWNLKQARAVSPRLWLGLRLGGSPIEVGVEGGFAWFPRLSQVSSIDGLSTVDVEMSAWTVALAVRYSLPLAVRWSVHLSVAGGVHYASNTLSTPGQPSLQDSHLGPLFRGAVGLAFHGLGGRVLVQLEYGLAPLGDGNVRGNAAGGGVALGYVASF